MLKLSENIKQILISLQKEKGIFLEGNILKVIDPENGEFCDYMKNAVEQDKSNRKKRLDVTKQIQLQNNQLILAQQENEKLLGELQEALKSAEEAKSHVEQDLDILQKKIQTELIGTIVKVALGVVLGVGIVTTILFIIALFMNKDTTLIGNAWSNMFGILLTNSFSIIGTIMGVKYASSEKK